MLVFFAWVEPECPRVFFYEHFDGSFQHLVGHDHVLVDDLQADWAPDIACLVLEVAIVFAKLSGSYCFPALNVLLYHLSFICLTALNCDRVSHELATDRAAKMFGNA